MSRVTDDLNTEVQPWIAPLKESSQLERLDCSVNPIMATPAYVGGFLAVTAAGAAGYAVEEVLGD